MDKILLTAFLSALAGFITAAVSIVKLVNEKESKTTDYRQAWTDSVRKALSEMVASINAQASNFHHSRVVSNYLSDGLAGMKSGEAPDAAKMFSELQSNLFEESVKAVRETRRKIHEHYAFTRLHFKPNDLSFNRIEQKFDVAMQLLTDLGESSDAEERARLKERVHAVADEITGYSRDILKCEWETIKKGESAYQKTKRWSIILGAIMLGLILTIGIHAALQAAKQIPEMSPQLNQPA